MSGEIRNRKQENNNKSPIPSESKSNISSESKDINNIKDKEQKNEGNMFSCFNLCFYLFLLALSLLFITSFIPPKLIINKTNQHYDQRTKDIKANIVVSLEDIYFGSTIEFQKSRNIVCPVCSGNGLRSDVNLKECNKCSGNGYITHVQRMGHMAFEQHIECPICKGSGYNIKPSDKCKHCKGEGMYREKQKLEMTVPKGLVEGGYIILEGKADEYPNANTGDLYVFVNSENHSFFTRKDDIHLECSTDISLLESLIGFKRKIKHISGEIIVLRREEITSHGQVIELKGKGLPMQNNPNEYGDMFITINVKFPSVLSNEDILKTHNLFDNIEWEK